MSSRSLRPCDCARGSPSSPRPFRVPTGDTGFRILGGLCFAWVALGSLGGGVPRNARAGCSGSTTTSSETWGVRPETFELFTLGTLAVLGILGAVGYLRARPVRAERRAAAPLEDAVPRRFLESGRPAVMLVPSSW